jgi:hypothetical protein
MEPHLLGATRSERILSSGTPRPTFSTSLPEDMTDAQKTTLSEIRLVGTSKLRRKLANCRKLLNTLQQAPTMDERGYELCRQIEGVVQSIEAELECRTHRPIARAAY